MSLRDLSLGRFVACWLLLDEEHPRATRTAGTTCDAACWPVRETGRETSMRKTKTTKTKKTRTARIQPLTSEKRDGVVPIGRLTARRDRSYAIQAPRTVTKMGDMTGATGGVL